MSAQTRTERTITRAGEPLLSAAELAVFLGVTRSWVYENASLLAAIPLGSGPRARLRFEREKALERLNACSPGRESSSEEVPAQPAIRARRRRDRADTNVVLLPIRGRSAPESDAKKAA